MNRPNATPSINSKVTHNIPLLSPPQNIIFLFSSSATVHSLLPSDLDLMFDRVTKAVMDALDFPDSPSSSSGFFGSLSVSDFSWPQSDEIVDSAKSLTSSSSESVKSPETKTIFDIFDLVRKQLGIRDEDSMSSATESDSYSSFRRFFPGFRGSSTLYSEEFPSAQPINKGNMLLSSGEEKQMIEALYKQKENNSSDTASFIVYFK